MISKIVMNGVASYKIPATLDTDKKVNIIYGLNGTGKSTLSNFLYEQDQAIYKNCSITNDGGAELIVYNQRFIKETFYESEAIPGIFSLSKENKEAAEKIRVAQPKLEQLIASSVEKDAAKRKLEDSFSGKRQLALDETWKIKTDYSGGDRVLEFCLEGYKAKERLFAHIEGIEKGATAPTRTIAEIKAEVAALSGDSVQHENEFPLIQFSQKAVEEAQIFLDEIVGNKNSVVAALIQKLENSDWVRQGLRYLPTHLEEAGVPCPFCQEPTINEALKNSIQEYFDESYEKSIAEILSHASTYQEAILRLPEVNLFEGSAFMVDRLSEFKALYGELTSTLSSNLEAIKRKQASPSLSVSIVRTADIVDALNKVLTEVNLRIAAHNQKVSNKAAALDALKREFWGLMRLEYDQTISRYKIDLAQKVSDLQAVETEIGEISALIKQTRSEIAEIQKTTVNIEGAITGINASLLELGIDGFYIEKHSDNLYKISRPGEAESKFESFSEGEKMIISFLYFCEQCKGLKKADALPTKRIAVIDDPVSSLSHIFVFNMGRLIKSEFFASKSFEQVFVLTHSLYFFYELTDINKERREENQSLHRIVKSATGSQISKMKYEEIQNDYQAYWSVVNNESQPAALVANSMRNIIEYFFGFVLKSDLNNVFQKPELKSNKYQAFCRYVNRESHSIGQNIFDYKEFDYGAFKDGLRLVFSELGYSEHYERMSKISG